MKTGIASARIRDLTGYNPSGAITYDGDYSANITLTAVTSTYFAKYFPANPGETITVNFKAKLNTGAASVAFDYPTTGTIVNKIDLEGDTWREYELSYTIPLTALTSEYVKCAIGKFDDITSTNVDISDIKFSVSDSRLPFARVYGLALLKLELGVASINDNFSCIGISASECSAATTTMTIKLPLSSSVEGLFLNPIIYVQLSADSVGANYFARASGYDNSTGEFTVSFFDTTGTAKDISVFSTLYLWVQAFGV